jgi:hypothetical protein
MTAGSLSASDHVVARRMVEHGYLVIVGYGKDSF